jgi:hypothetical protein
MTSIPIPARRACAGDAFGFLWCLPEYPRMHVIVRTVCNGHYRQMDETDYVVFEFAPSFRMLVTICILFRAIGERKEVRIHSEG